MIIFNWLLGISLDFANVMFKSWLAERDISSIVAALKKAQIENKLLVCIWFHDLLKTLHIHVFKFIFCKFLMLHVVSVCIFLSDSVNFPGFQTIFCFVITGIVSSQQERSRYFCGSFQESWFGSHSWFSGKIELCVSKETILYYLSSQSCAEIPSNSFYFILGHSKK